MSSEHATPARPAGATGDPRHTLPSAPYPPAPAQPPQAASATPVQGSGQEFAGDRSQPLVAPHTQPQADHAFPRNSAQPPTQHSWIPGAESAQSLADRESATGGRPGPWGPVPPPQAFGGERSEPSQAPAHHQPDHAFPSNPAQPPAQAAWPPGADGSHPNGDRESATGAQPGPWGPIPPPPPFGGPGNRPNGAGGPANGRGSDLRAERQVPGSGPILVQPFAGFGVAAEFDPGTGALQAVPASNGTRGGVYGDLGESRVVFYRDGAGLALRVDGRTIDLGGPVRVEWVLLERRTTRFAVIENGVVVFEVRYRTLPPEMDLGALVHSVLADPQRREQTFRG